MRKASSLRQTLPLLLCLAAFFALFAFVNFCWMPRFIDAEKTPTQGVAASPDVTSIFPLPSGSSLGTSVIVFGISTAASPGRNIGG